MDIRDNQLSLGGCPAEALAGEFGTPLYVYEEEMIRRQCALFKESFAATPLDIHYAMKANSNPAILTILREEVQPRKFVREAVGATLIETN